MKAQEEFILAQQSCRRATKKALGVFLSAISPETPYAYPMRQVLDFLWLLLGFLLVGLGIVLWILPIVPGWPLLIPGLAILGARFKWARKLLQRVRLAKREKRWPPDKPPESSDHR